MVSLHTEKESNRHAEAHAYISKQTIPFIRKWGPRTVSALIGGYYGLGVAYYLGVMQAIDKVAIFILKRTVGYVGIGTIMPTFQQYSAWAVRTLSALSTGLLYDTAEKTAIYAVKRIRKKYAEARTGK